MSSIVDRFSRDRTRNFEALKTNAVRARQPYDKDVLLNVAFYLDQQYTEWAADAGTIRAIPRPQTDDLPRPVANKIVHFVLKQHGAALKDEPTIDVLPATDDPIDMSMGSVALSYLRWLTDPQVADLTGELADAALWALAGGEAFLKWTYNPKLNRPDIMSCSPLEIAIDPYARRWREVRYIIHEKFMDTQQIEDLYGVKVKPEAVSRADLQKAALLRDMGMAPILEGAVVNELWVKPGVDKRFSKGLFVVWSGKDILVEPQDYPYNHGHLPFTQIGAIPRPGSPHYTCTVKYLRSPQMELNKYHAQRISVRTNFSNPKWWIPAELELEQLPDDSPNQILRGQSGGGQYEPKILQPTVFPENTDGTWIREEMMDVAGQHEISQGRVPGRVEAARAIEMLSAADDSHLSELRRTIGAALSEGGWQALMLTKQFRNEEIMVQTYSREGLPEVRRFLSEKIKPGMRVKVTLGTGLANSRAQRQQQVLEMWNSGIIQDPEVMTELMDIPIGKLRPGDVFDTRLARNENMLFAADEGIDGTPGNAINPASWDNHPVHIREHNNFRKTSDYQQLEDTAKQKIEHHVEQHEVLYDQQIQKEVARQALMQGAAAPGAAPPGADGQPAPAEATPGEGQGSPGVGPPQGEPSGPVA
jgi:hypothetical protein